MVNDDGWIIGAYGPPLTPDIMREKMIESYKGSPVDVFLWSIGGHETYDYETEIGEIFGDGYDDLDEALGDRDRPAVSRSRQAILPLRAHERALRHGGILPQLRSSAA